MKQQTIGLVLLAWLSSIGTPAIYLCDIIRDGLRPICEPMLRFLAKLLEGDAE